jgi:prevent-host-death family protein
MPWNIAQAKQHFSEVVKQAAEEPQLIYNRNQPVAVVIDAKEFARFEEWKKAQEKPRTLAEDFAELRELLKEEGFEDGLEIPPRVDRPNAFVEMLEEEYGELPR